MRKLPTILEGTEGPHAKILSTSLTDLLWGRGEWRTGKAAGYS